MCSTEGLPELFSVYSLRSIPRLERRVPEDEAQPVANVPRASYERLQKEL